MVSSSATMVTPPDTDTMARSRRLARPVDVMHPATTPAMAQAAATVMVPLAPASRASIIFWREMLSEVSPLFVAALTMLLTPPTRMVMMMAMAAADCMVREPLDTSTTSTTSGSSR